MLFGIACYQVYASQIAMLFQHEFPFKNGSQLTD